MSCGTKNCDNHILLTCEICKPQVSFCRACVSEHQNLFPTHSYKSTFLKIDKTGKDLFLISINNLLKAVQEAKKGIVYELKILMKKLIKKSQTELIDLSNKENLYYAAIERLGEKKRIDTLSMSEAEKFIVTMIEDKRKFGEDMKLIKSKVSIFDEIILAENCSIKLLEELKKNKEEHSIISKMIGEEVLESMKKEDDPPRINYFKEGTKSLITVNVLENKDSASPVAGLVDDLCRYSGYCQISEGKLFCYGGYNSNRVANWYYLIDIEKKNAQKLGVRKNIYANSCCYHKSSVYVFGGCSPHGFTNEAEVYNFLDWKTLAPLPSILGYINRNQVKNSDYIYAKYLPSFVGSNTTASFGNNIAILGCHSINLSIYDTISNSYTIACAFEENIYKFLISAKNKIYIFDNSKLYRLNFLSLINQTLISSSTGVPNSFVIDQAILHKNNIYFILGNYQLYCFNLETEKASLLGET